MEEQVLDFFKTFCSADRLRIAALLVEEPCSVEEIATRLNLRPADLPRQLAQIERLGLLQKDGASYRLDEKALEALSRAVLAGRRPAVEAHSNDENADEFERTVIKNYSLPDGRLKEIPMQEKKLLAILKHVVQVFEPGVQYNEKQVNEALKRFHPDSATLRRALVDRHMIVRELNGAAYWLPRSEN
jgi:hypothetical protein